MAPNIKNLLGQLQFTSRLFYFLLYLYANTRCSDEELSTTQRHLDMAGVPMPNFMNVGHSLRRELNESDEDDDFNQYLQIDFRVPFILKTPELIIEEEESDPETPLEGDTEEGTRNMLLFVL